MRARLPLIVAIVVLTGAQSVSWASGRPRACHPSESATPIAYTKSVEGNADIWVTHGGHDRRITSVPEEDRNPEWSPDGRLIAFESGRDGDMDIYVMRPDGSGVRRVTDTDVDERNATWSPDGRWIAYHSNRGDGFDLFRMRADGSGRELKITDSPGVKDVKPSWSPDGALIAYESDAAGPGTLNDDIWVRRVDGSRPLRLTTHPHRDWFPAWSPDGRSLVFQSLRSGNWELYVVGRNGTGERRLTTTAAGVEHEPTWSPDGTRIAFMRAEPGVAPPILVLFVEYWPDGAADLYSVSPEGTNERVLVNDEFDKGTPEYRPCPSVNGVRRSS